jgi:hydrogenase nickel incorporation protein HypA/HybF
MAMHELGLAVELIAMAEERGGAARIQRLVVEIGALALVVPDALRFAFEVASHGTCAEGAILEVVEVPGRARCRGCGAAVTLDRPFGRCGCGGCDLAIESGSELRLREMEVM